MNSKRRSIIKIRLSEQDIIKGEITGEVIGNGDGFTGEKSRDTRVTREEEEVSVDETLRDDMIWKSEGV